MLFLVFLRERRRSEARVVALRRMAGVSGPAAEIAVGPTELDDLDVADGEFHPGDVYRTG